MPKVSSYFPVDTGRKLNVYKTFKGRPGRLLNVLCTLNLRPVSTGFSENVIFTTVVFNWYVDVSNTPVEEILSG